MNTITDFLLSLIYPEVCGFCGKIDENALCNDCKGKINSSLIYKINEVKNTYFEKHINIAMYDEIFRKYILDYKFYDKSYMYKTFSKIILKNKKICKIIRKL